MFIYIHIIFRLLLRKEGLNFSTSAEFEVVRAIKEKACYVALSPVKEETSQSNTYQYMLPDGNKVDVSLYKNQLIINYMITACICQS